MKIKLVIILLFSPFFICASAEERWKTVDEGFRMTIPASWEKQPEHGIDSNAGGYSGKTADLEFDEVRGLGYTEENSKSTIESLNSKLADPKKLAKGEEVWKVAGRIADFETGKLDPKIYGQRRFTNIASLHVPYANEPGYLEMYVIYESDKDMPTVRRVLQSIQWKTIQVDAPVSKKAGLITKVNPVSVRVFVRNQKDSQAKQRSNVVNTKEVFYYTGEGGAIESFVTLSGPTRGRWYVFPTPDSPGCFYFSSEHGLSVCYYIRGEVMWFHSYFDVSDSTPPEEIAKRMASEFRSDSKAVLDIEGSKAARVDLGPNANEVFFTPGSRGGNGSGHVKVVGIELAGSDLQLDLLSDGGKYRGSFWIDMKAKRVRKSLVVSVADGKRVFP
jgi:hypothetical protein